MNTDQVMNKVLTLIDQIQAGVINIAPQAIELVYKATMWKGIGLIALGVFLLLLAILFFIGVIKTDDNDSDSGSFCFVLSITSFVISLFLLLNIWNWVAIFNPQVYLAHKTIEKVMEKE